MLINNWRWFCATAYLTEHLGSDTKICRLIWNVNFVFIKRMLTCFTDGSKKNGNITFRKYVTASGFFTVNKHNEKQRSFYLDLNQW